MYQKTTLPCGVRLVTEEIPAFSSVAIGFWVNVGSKIEDPAEAGMSHLLEHLLFKGTHERTAREIAELLDSVGGHLNAFTSKEHTCYYAKVLDEHFPLAFDVLADMFLNPRLALEDVEREKKVVLEEINMYEDSPDELIHDLLAQSVWSHHPLGRPVLGTHKSVANLNPRQIRSFFQRHYTPSNLVIAVAGNIKHDQVVSKCDTYFTPDTPTHMTESNSPAYQPQFQAGPKVFTRTLEQVHLCLGAPGVPITDEDNYAIDVANSILGGGLSSRLFQHIREEHGLAYSVYSYHVAYQDSGLLTIYAGLNKVNLKAGLELIQKELDTMSREAIVASELDRAKQQVLGSFFLGLENTTNRMIRLGKQELSLQRWVSPDEVRNKIQAVTPEDVLDICSRLFQKNGLAVAILGPVEMGEVTW